jgi:putative SOS response-associated peptidase YedK
MTMCGRYTIFTEDEIIEMREIINEISKTFGPQAIKTGEIFPADTVPLVALADGKIEVTRGTWGFPSWEPGKRPIINARSESAREKRMFAEPLRQGRCVVPSTGYYEWMREGKKAADKFMLREPGSKMLYMAGVQRQYQDKGGEWRNHFVILTREPTAFISAFHDRMPVILRKDEIARWLRSDEHVLDVFIRPGPELVRTPA